MPALVGRLYEVVRELERLFPGRPFTLDGHLVGSIGEVLGAALYDLQLLPCSTESHDAQTGTGQLVQIKATQGQQVAIRSCCDHMLVLKLLDDGTVQEAYNGPGTLAWDAAGPMQKNGQRSIRLSTLARLMEFVDPSDRLPRVDA